MNQKKELPKVYINIVTWNGETWIGKCLQSIFASDYDNFTVTVVDNNSQDGTCGIIQKDFKNVLVFKNARNVGFGEGHNRGIRYALKKNAKYMVLLNQDIIVEPDWLKELVSAAESADDFSILTPFQFDYEGERAEPHFLSRLLLYSNDFRTDYEKSELKRIYEHGYSFGAAIFIRRDVFLKAGLFDPFYFMYHEEGDFFQRCFYYGYRMALVTRCKIYHYHTAVHPEKMSLALKFYSYRNSFISRLKNPNISFHVNLLSCLREALNLIRTNARSIKGLIKLLAISAIEIHVIFLIPYIFFKRQREMKRPCYLDE